MSSIAIRAATTANLNRITEIYADAVTHGTASYELEPPSRAEMGSRFDSLAAGGFPYLVAERDGVVLGYAYAGPFRPRPAYRFVVEDSVYVAPEAKGQGVGRLLMQGLIEAAEAAGFRQIIAVIGDGHADSASVRLHEKLGFRHSGRLEGSGYKHGRWLDTVFMQLSLNGGAGLSPDPDSWPERRFRDGLRGK
ncbi:MAG: GNAT family N-acetyltransferase [Mesorhizobium sp.]|uniref:GNAT family N-acetyltransferase n=1 Tax=unclassified Mesorhizobium TaxID=325217 RepID=UPI000F75682D|nr:MULTISPECIES: GNAT family N-acetyltransferase [unclassified Mesorhizobium]AZO49977.1 N-acetyltransferase family protein [Mesorhizobium sp. M4B.F.Ca.ET.058.02.1.1]RUX48957.1 GNAT family N-acetyltransferase [Mesorhizobium sp. M4A.F.Ca.ET.050.02.1.1]RVC45237.1 GNAT family N-acetyltransferase [Mesorhizobium sp. M4A.F.Ca.ET.090.04.2.1]RVD34886.1 GNAT family N-acetyltransferase [Mesorhizobium sp. M4A.F.Ca.ET.020.02.1.1]RWC09753.1 MAG: GNAT family N-acetyltransferase [Mesorhizobium sp.]